MEQLLPQRPQLLESLKNEALLLHEPMQLV
jgi:hypothetical protein